ncbi:hypothetical protein HYH02_005574 [Chlamydomonas schloesseri]|uniref:Glutathione peroxidase n=1 Tax=Chlamydomonas schloesseri TaxID=2026947 RepID=A0A835WKT9_9CHLO|nr:hypothetical protein HYH02_005574 [Chlamydomonas schloesseri]|eukprot:KAG2449427.1 hypothetical protein HYH02_005574 [Chlamydomonas schloesseri]
MSNPEFYGLSTTTLQGQPFPFSQLKGKVVLIVNVASKCGFTPQYKGLEELYQRYKDRGLIILGFPCNQFGGQEPGDAGAIGEFCQRNFGVTFPIMERSDVNGNDANPVFKYLKTQKKQFMMEMIKWNFEKFLVDKTGQVVARYSSMATPASLGPEVEKLLAA